MPKVKLPKKSTLIAKLDKLVGDKCRAEGICSRCGSKETLQWAHISTRRYLSTRWMPENYVCICASCHFWGHKNPTLFTEWIIAKYGKERIDKLHKQLQRGETWDIHKMMTLYAQLV